MADFGLLCAIKTTLLTSSAKFNNWLIRDNTHILKLTQKARAITSNGLQISSARLYTK